MNRDALDEFFAKADDVLTDWNPDLYEHPDVMVARVDDADADLPVADSYYAQVSEWFWEQPEPRAEWQGAVPTFVILDEVPRLNESARDRALRLRLERNTGPADRRGLDGRRRRRP